MSYTNGLDKPSDYFNTKIYTGNNSSQTITGVGFQPDWVWFKSRTTTDSHYLVDSVRGNTKYIRSQTNTAEETNSTAVTSFNSDGYALGSAGNVNDNANYVSWNWKAGGTASSNTDGSITSSVSVNTTAGFSIVSYTGTGSAATVGHGLGSELACYIIKQRDATGGWIVYHKGNTSSPETDYLRLDKTDATVDDAIFNDTAPTSSVFSIGTNAPVNTSSGTYIAYCFAEKKGYSKFSSYLGNGNANGNFNYLGFLPSLIILKGNNTENWSMYDNKRLGYNVDNNVLYPNATSTEGNSDDIDFLSNGFKIRRQTGLLNDSGVEYIYMAFAENPFVTSTGIPTTAR